jgi:hypothetical protein
MSKAELTVEGVLADLRQSDRSAYLEQRIFVLSPFGTGVTALILFVLAAGSYVLLASLDHLPILVHQNDGLALHAQARAAFILSLLIAVILGMQRYVRVAERAEMVQVVGLFRGGLSTVARMAELTPSNAQLGLATLIGLFFGLVFVWLFLDPVSALRTIPGAFLWIATATVLLTMSFTRGVELTRRGTQSGNVMIDDDLVIDLLRIDRLSFLGRSAGRFALIWFSVSAVWCLFFV